MPWLRMFFKSQKQKVYAFVGPDGQLTLDANNKAQIRYSMKDARTYSAARQNLQPIPGETPLDAEPPPSAPPKRHPIAFAESDPPPLPPPPGTVYVFTDGACSGNPGPSAAAAVLVFGDQTKEIAEFLGQGTNNTAELTAILRALQHIRTRHHHVHLYTDSAYAIGILSQGWHAHANQTLVEDLTGLIESFPNLKFFKIKGHAGHALNERADHLAREAIAQALKPPPAPLPPATLPATDGPTLALTPPPAPPRIVENPPLIPNTHEPGTVLIFTDGACEGNPGPASIGVVISSDQGTQEWGEFLGQGTNNIAELTAILRALERAPTHLPVHLYTDSAYAIGIIAKNWKVKQNKELVHQLRRAIERFPRLTFFKVKGHAGHHLNERVDQLARDAIAQTLPKP